MRAWGGIAGLQYALPATWQPWQQAGMNLTRFVEVRGGCAAGHNAAVLSCRSGAGGVGFSYWCSLKTQQVASADCPLLLCKPYLPLQLLPPPACRPGRPCLPAWPTLTNGRAG